MLLLCLGSNLQQVYNITQAQQHLLAAIPSLRFSRNLWTVPFGHPTPLYLNCLAYSESTIDYPSLLHLTKQIEQQMGRHTHLQPHMVPIDIDILQCGDTRYHIDDWSRPYVVQLLEELNS